MEENNQIIDSVAAGTRTLAQTDHPQASSVSTLGILGLVFTFVFGLVGLILNIINLSKSSAANMDIAQNPGMYTEDSIRKIRSGRTCSIVGLSIQGGLVLIILLIFAAVS